MRQKERTDLLSNIPKMDLPLISFNPIFPLTITASLCLFLNLSFLQHAIASDIILRNDIDKLALLAIKSHITEDPHGILDSWNDSSHYCNWTGVSCSLRAQRVIGINLTRQSLAGIIPLDIRNLTFIKLIDLSGNSLRGEIPPEIGNLGRLRVLNTGNNFLGGHIPSSLSNCSNLRNLALDHNYLKGIVPPSIGSLSKLTTLNLGTNNLTGTFPSSFGNLTYLQELDMSYNEMKGEVPRTISRLNRLRVFRVSVNSFSGEFPPPLYNLTSLEFIAFSFNNFNGNIRNDIGLVLPNLQKIWLPFNFFTGPIPDSFVNASNLQDIDLIHNNFTGKVPLNWGVLDLHHINIGYNHLGDGGFDDLSFINSLTNCSNLDFLDISSNHFEGVLPVSITNLSNKLTRLFFEENSIIGNIPRGISNLESLNILVMDSNNLNGNIPDTFGSLSNLRVLSLPSNRLNGRIPSSIGNITLLSWLVLFNNHLEGSIPSTLANCQQLTILYLAQNNLTGFIPQEITAISSLLSINVSYNSLKGMIPQNIGNLTHLVEINLSYNNFSGEVPSSIGNCLDMNIVFLEGNSFHGGIQHLARLKNLNYLDLSSNDFSGNIPDFLLNLPFLLYLNISFNDFEGWIPSVGIFSNMTAIDVRENPKLCGGVLDLHLPACPKQEDANSEKKHGRKLILIIVITSSFAALSLLLLLICWMKRRLKKQKLPISESRSFKFYPRVSYEELLKATNGFSSENLIGSGSFGRVYKGSLGSDRTAIAVKVLNLKKKEASKSFMAECEALRNIRHNNLVKVITACSSTDYQGNDFKAVVYELMPNGSLDEWLHPEEGQNNLNIVQRINIVTDIASALFYLHHQCQMPVIHCDLKPHNVLLDGDMIAHVGDFGLARIDSMFNTNGNSEVFSSLNVKGTIGYAAPEYGMGAKVSTQGDVYSFGILLLEIFTGKRPTDSLFQENLSLHHFVKMALRERVMEVLDNSALNEEGTGKAQTWEEAWINLKREQRDCLMDVLRIGIACSSEFPRDRMSMHQVYQELSMIRTSFLILAK